MYNELQYIHYFMLRFYEPFPLAFFSPLNGVLQRYFYIHHIQTHRNTSDHGGVED